MGILKLFGIFIWDGEESQVGICEYDVGEVFIFYCDFCVCLVQDRLNLSLVLLSSLLTSQLVMKQSWAKRHSQGFIPTVSCFNSLPISSNGMALNKIIAAGRSVMSISSTEQL